MSHFDPTDINFSDDAMDWTANPVAVTCAKCLRPGERNLFYCGPDQRRRTDEWGYPVNRGRRRISITERIVRRLLGSPVPLQDRFVAEDCSLPGEHFHCPTCDASSEVWSRVTGYLRPVANYNDGKRQEYTDRKKYRFPERAA